MKSLVFAAVVVLSIGAFGVAQENDIQDRWTPEACMQVRTPGDVAISPDALWIAYTVTSAEMGSERSEFRTHIWLSRSDGSRGFQLTVGEDSCWAPAWSPDGKWIAFLSARGGNVDIWLINPRGGEASRLTDAETGVGMFRWSPDGGRIAFLMADPEPEEWKKSRKAKNDSWVVDSRFRYDHLYLIDFDPEGVEHPTPVRLTEGSFHVTDLDWSPDGKTIAFCHQPTPLYDDWFNGDISIVPAGGGEAIPLVCRPGFEAQPMFSPDGKSVAFVSSRGDTCWALDLWICLAPAGGGDVKVLSRTRDHKPTLISWLPDGIGLYYLETDWMSTRIFHMPADGSFYRQITDFGGVISSPVSSAGGELKAFVFEDINEAPEVYVLPRYESKLVKVSNVNAHLPELPFSQSELFEYYSFDGKAIEGILHYPLGYKEGRKYPLILAVHEGSFGVATRTFSAKADYYPIQAMTARGFAVLRPNQRGSTGFGKDVRFATVGRMGEIDYKDLMAGVDDLVNKGLADPDRLGIMGWSYGGYLTAVAVTKSNRFKAAVGIATPTDAVSLTGTSDIPGFYPSYLGVELWEDYSLYQKVSPIFRVENVTTPLLLIHGELDNIVPTSQSYEFYRILRRKGVDTELVILPRTGHGPDEPKLLLDVMKRQIAWLSEKLLGDK